MAAKGKDTGKGAKKTPREEEKEKSIDFSDPLCLIDVLNETNVGRVLQALKSLKSFVRESLVNDLLERALLDKIIILVQDKKSALEVIEFSLDLLSELLNFNKVVRRLADEQDFILLIYSFIKTKPLDIQVQCLKVLSSLTTLDGVCHIIAANCDLNLLFVRISQKDPDVHAGILKIMYNLMENDIVIAEKIVNLPGFSYSAFLQMLSSDYPLVQHRALNMIIHITLYDHLTILKEIFIEENGIYFVIKMLETHKWPDLHEKVFKILVNVSCIPETYNKLGETGIKFLMIYVDEIESHKLQLAAYETILKMIKKSPLGLTVFVENGLFDLVMKHLKGDSDNLMFRLSVKGIAALCENNDALVLMEEVPDLILLMFGVLNSKRELFDWSIRLDAATAIHSMATKSGIFFECIMTNRKWEILLDLLKKYPGIAPFELTLLLASTLKGMIMPVFNSIECPGETCNKLIHVLKYLLIDPQCRRGELKCVASEMFQELIEFSEFRDVLKAKKFYRCLSKLLFKTTDNPTVLETNLKLFITLIEWDSTFIDDLTYINAIDWFIGKREIYRNLPMARRFLDLVFDKCKYIKIHFTNRLEPWDIIKTGFYIQRGIPDSSLFKSLITYLHEKYVKSRPVYYINLHNHETIEELQRRFTEESVLTYFDAVSLFPTENACVVHELEHLNDSFLNHHLQGLKIHLGLPVHHNVALNLSEVLNRNDYINKVKMLADFVCNIMSSLDKEEEECENHSFELHLTELKNNLGSAVIPLGYLKLGMKLERALLFKVLGDQVGIPSALVRARCGVGWNEIYLPPLKRPTEESLQWIAPTSENTSLATKRSSLNTRKSDMSHRKSKSLDNRTHSILRKSVSKMEKKLSKKSFARSKSLDTKGEEEPLLPSFWHLNAYEVYMKTNHILDLDQYPGELYQIGSVEAEDYASEQIPVHSYFFHRTQLPQLVKSSKVTPRQSINTFK